MSEHADPTQLPPPSVDANQSSPEPSAPDVLPPQPELPPEPPAQPQSYTQPQEQYVQPQQHTEPQAQPQQPLQPQPQPQAAATGTTAGSTTIAEAPPTYSDTIQQSKHGTYPVPQGAVPVPQGAVPVPQGAVPVPQGAVPVQQGAYPLQQGAYPVQQGAYPVQQGAYPVQYFQRPGQPQFVHLQQPGAQPGVQAMPYAVQAPFQLVAVLPRPNYPGPHDFLMIAVLTTIFFGFMNITSLMFGIPAVIFAIQSKNNKEMANYPAAKRNGNAALGLTVTNIIYTLSIAVFLIGLSLGLYASTICRTLRFSTSRGYYCW